MRGCVGGKLFVCGGFLHGVCEFLLMYILMYLYNYVKVGLCIYMYV